MSYKKHYLLQWGGSLYGTAEAWACSVRMEHDDPAPLTDTLRIAYARDAVDDLAQDVRTFHATAGLICSQALLTFVKFNAIGEDGRYLDKSGTTEIRYDATTDVAGASSSTVAPQLAARITLLTDQARGPGSRGGWFVPLPGAAAGFDNDGTMSMPGTQALRDAAALFLNNINNTPGIDVLSPKAVVASQGGRGRPEAFNAVVRRVTVGQVVDTQRRRRRSIPEQYIPPVAVN